MVCWHITQPQVHACLTFFHLFCGRLFLLMQRNPLCTYYTIHEQWYSLYFLSHVCAYNRPIACNAWFTKGRNIYGVHKTYVQNAEGILTEKAAPPPPMFESQKKWYIKKRGPIFCALQTAWGSFVFIVQVDINQVRIRL